MLRVRPPPAVPCACAVGRSKANANAVSTAARRRCAPPRTPRTMGKATRAPGSGQATVHDALVVGGGGAGTFAVARLLDARAASVLWCSANESFGAGNLRNFQNAPANTAAVRVGDWFAGPNAPRVAQDLAESSTQVRDAFDAAAASRGGVGGRDVAGMDLRSYHPLARCADALDALAAGLLKRGEGVVHAQPCTHVASLARLAGAWEARDAQDRVIGVARHVVVCVGARPVAPKLDLAEAWAAHSAYNGVAPAVVPLETALSPADLVEPAEHVVVVGASHSGALVAMNFANVARRVSVLHRSPVKLALNLGTEYGYLFEFTGLKGRAAAFAMEMGWTSIGETLELASESVQEEAVRLCGNALAGEFGGTKLRSGPPQSVRVPTAFENVRLIESKGDAYPMDALYNHGGAPTHVVYATGFARSAADLPALHTAEGHRMDEEAVWHAVAAAAHAEPSAPRPPEGLHGLGIAFPELYRSFYDATPGEEAIGIGMWSTRGEEIARVVMQ